MPFEIQCFLMHIWDKSFFKLYYLSFISFAGTPPTIVFLETSLLTTAPAATTAHAPILTPLKITQFEPIQTFSPIFILLKLCPW